MDEQEFKLVRRKLPCCKRTQEHINGIVIDLKGLAENYKKEMSVNVYESIWNLIQSIEKRTNETDE